MRVRCDFVSVKNQSANRCPCGRGDLGCDRRDQAVLRCGIALIEFCSRLGRELKKSGIGNCAPARWCWRRSRCGSQRFRRQHGLSPASIPARTDRPPAVFQNFRPRGRAGNAQLGEPAGGLRQQIHRDRYRRRAARLGTFSGGISARMHRTEDRVSAERRHRYRNSGSVARSD